jgi:hypothetical protein
MIADIPFHRNPVGYLRTMQRRKKKKWSQPRRFLSQGNKDYLASSDSSFNAPSGFL